MLLQNVMSDRISAIPILSAFLISVFPALCFFYDQCYTVMCALHKSFFSFFLCYTFILRVLHTIAPVYNNYYMRSSHNMHCNFILGVLHTMCLQNCILYVLDIISAVPLFFILDTVRNKRLIKPLLVVRVGPGTNPKYGSH